MRSDIEHGGAAKAFRCAGRVDMVFIAAVMIAKNEQRCITRALDSIRPFVDAMIVLDTGSTDETIAYAQKAGAAVYSYSWCDDFSKARNAALDHSPAQWNLIIDADEYLVSGGEHLPSLASDPPSYVGAVAMESLYTHEGNTHSARNWLTRLLPQSVRYAGRVHEQPIHQLPVRHLPLHFAHDGYQPQQHAHKRGRNAVLLRAELQQSPDDAYLHYQLGKEYEIDHHYEQASACYHIALEKSGTVMETWHRDLVLRQLFCLKKTNAFPSALELAAQWENNLNDIPDYHFVLGDIYLDLALLHPEDSQTLLPLIEAHWLKCLEIGERPDLDGCVIGRGSTLAQHNLHIFYESLGLHDKAKHFHKWERH
jgi:glycosyltransferase involved in cell wall biosynthesis